MKTLLLFGGTFNPVHKGHKNLLKTISERLRPDKIIIMPSNVPPHKNAPELASGEDRLNMCRLAFSEFENAEFSDFELNNSGKSYSYYTLKYLKEKFPEYKIWFAVGSDMLLTFDRWFKYRELLSMCSLDCISREKGDFENLEKKAEELSDFGEIKLISAPPFEVSSTAVRRMIKNNEDCSCYLDENVVKYIIDNKLYK